MKNYKCVKTLYIGECESGFDFMMRLHSIRADKIFSYHISSQGLTRKKYFTWNAKNYFKIYSLWAFKKSGFNSIFSNQLICLFFELNHFYININVEKRVEYSIPDLTHNGQDLYTIYVSCSWKEYLCWAFLL